MQLSDCEQLANELLTQHNLNEWRFKFDNAKRRFGYCRYTNKTISLSKPLVLLNEEARVKNTILHEIAHALLPAGVGHNNIWRQKAKQIGCDGLRCYDNTVITPPKKYIGTCPTCGRTIKRIHRYRIACGVCCKGHFDAKHLFTWTKLFE